MNKLYLIFIFLILLFSFSIQSCRKADEFADGDDAAFFAGGAQTVFDESGAAFSSAFPGLSSSQATLHEIGDGAFSETFVSAPALLHQGLGPIFNNVSCSSCHIADGRGRPPVNVNEPLSSMLIRISIPGQDLHGGPLAVLGFGTQLQQRSINGKMAEANVEINYLEQPYTYPDGENYSLRQPVYSFNNPYTTLPSNTLSSGRVAPAVFGLGLLEAIDENDLLALSDPNDFNGDGIKGKANRVWDAINKKTTIGRFGWKAGNPSLLQQTAGAYNEDMGITSFVFPTESSNNQIQYDGINDETEVSDSILYMVAFYLRSLAVPAPRKLNDLEIQHGKKIFTQINCVGCHHAQFITATNVVFPALSNQKIFPYTDLLLHDMGNGLSDNRPDFLASGNEWRTAPLWGIGLTKKVNGHNFFLHDGRARNLEEAIMWHGGEAVNAKNSFAQLSKNDRGALIKFLNAL